MKCGGKFSGSVLICITCGAHASKTAKRGAANVILVPTVRNLTVGQPPEWCVFEDTDFGSTQSQNPHPSRLGIAAPLTL